MYRRALVGISMLVLTGCPVEVPEPNSCPEPTGPGVTHQGILTADETWRAEDGPHLVPAELYVRATLTIEACAVVRVAEGVSITVGDSVTPGRIIAHGTTDGTVSRRIRFESAVANTFWGGLFVNPTSSLDFERVDVDHGGAASSSNASIEVRGPDTGEVEASLRMLYSRVDASGTQGIRLARGAGFTSDSTDLTITGSGAQPDVSPSNPTGYPIDVDPPAVHTLPVGTYAGNRRDEIIVRGAQVIIDEGFPNLGVPYLVAETFQMDDPDGGDPTLTIDAGATLRFAESSGGGVAMILGNIASASEVRLVVAGTASEPVTFTSAASAPSSGAWAGIMMANAPATGNVLSHAIIEYTGGATSTRGYGCGPMENVGGLIVIEWQPQEAFVTGSVFRHSIGAGIVSGWALADGETAVDLRADNVFEDIQDYMDEGHCEVTEWTPATPDCRVPRVSGVTCVGM